jgi:serine/threonine protein kinase
MMKADIWAFGCIMLEILFYSSPAFYAINNSNQIKQINAFLQPNKKVGHSLKSCIARLMDINENTSNSDCTKSRHKE